MKQNLFQTIYFKSIDLQEEMRKVIRFVIDNRGDYLLDNDIKVNALSHTTPMIKNPISILFDNIKRTNNLNSFAIFNLNDVLDPPNVLNWTFFDIDLLVLKQSFPELVDVVNTFPELNDKIFFNITSIYNKSTQTISNVPYLQKIVIRDLCSRAYNFNSSSWIPVNLLRDLVDFYTIAISSSIARLFNFSFTEQKMIAIPLAYYFTMKNFDNLNDGVTFVSTLSSLGDKQTIISILENMQDIIAEKKLDINKQSDLITIIKEMSPARLGILNQKIFNTSCRSMNIDQIVSLLAIEYPPYWLYTVLAAASGESNNLYFALKRIDYLKKLNQFALAFTQTDVLTNI